MHKRVKINGVAFPIMHPLLPTATYTYSPIHFLHYTYTFPALHLHISCITHYTYKGKSYRAPAATYCHIHLFSYTLPTLHLHFLLYTYTFPALHLQRKMFFPTVHPLLPTVTYTFSPIHILHYTYKGHISFYVPTATCSIHLSS